MKYILVNPCFILGVAFLTSLLSTTLGWSNLFEELDNSTKYVYILSSLILIFVGIVTAICFRRVLRRKIVRICKSYHPSNNDYIYFLFAFLFFLLEVLYSRTLPIFSSSYMSAIDSKFGFPIIHGFYLALLSYLSMYYFQVYLNSKYHRYLCFIIIISMIFILMSRRGTLVFHFLSYVFMYIIHYFNAKKVSWKLISRFFILFVLFMFLFSYIGNKRLGHDNNDYILNVGKASEQFKESMIPSSFFFTYLYVSTPVHIFNLNKVEKGSSYADYFVDNILPDFISNRIAPKPVHEVVSVDGFTVGGVFTLPYIYKGFVGVVIIMLYYLTLCSFVFIMLMQGAKRSILSLSMLLSITVLLSFSNLLNSTAYMMPFFYSLIFRDFNSLRWGGKNIIKVKGG